MSFPRAVVRLILKKTSLLLSVTLMLRCSLCPASSGLWATLGDPLSDILLFGSAVRAWLKRNRVTGLVEADQLGSVVVGGGKSRVKSAAGGAGLLL